PVYTELYTLSLHDALPILVEFLNEQMDPAEVLALEVKQYVGEGGLRSLVPRLIGRTEQAQQKKAASEAQIRQWDEGSFFAVLREDRKSTRLNSSHVSISYA